MCSRVQRNMIHVQRGRELGRWGRRRGGGCAVEALEQHPCIPIIYSVLVTANTENRWPDGADV